MLYKELNQKSKVGDIQAPGSTSVVFFCKIDLEILYFNKYNLIKGNNL